MMPVAVGGLLSVLLSFLDVKNGMEIFLFSLKKIFLTFLAGVGRRKKYGFLIRVRSPTNSDFVIGYLTNYA